MVGRVGDKQIRRCVYAHLNFRNIKQLYTYISLPQSSVFKCHLRSISHSGNVTERDIETENWPHQKEYFRRSFLMIVRQGLVACTWQQSRRLIYQDFEEIKIRSDCRLCFNGYYLHGKVNNFLQLLIA